MAFLYTVLVFYRNRPAGAGPMAGWPDTGDSRMNVRAHLKKEVSRRWEEYESIHGPYHP